MSPTVPTREIRAVLDDVANALQGAAGLAGHVRRQAQTTADDTVKLEEAIARAASGFRRLQPGSGSGKGRR